MSENVLTPKQRRGLAAILASPTLAAAAAQAHVNPKTLTRWLVQPAFITALKAAQAAVIDRAAGRLVQELDRSIDTLAELRSGGGEGVRLRAATELIDKCFAVRENSDLERRLAELERQAQK